MPSPKQKKKPASKRVLEILLIILFIAVLILIVMEVVKINTGINKTVETPNYIIRLQIIYNANQVRYVEQLEDFLSGYNNSEYNIEIVDKTLFNIKEINESIIIDRTKENQYDKLIADILNIDHGDIVYKKMEENKNDVAVTFVIGSDIEKLSGLPGDEGAVE